MFVHSFRCLCALFCATLALPAASLPDNVIAVVKFVPPKQFTENAMAAARAIQPGQQTEMLPLFMLGAFGYPNYPGVSETDNVSVFLFDAGDEAATMPYVVMAKVAKDAQLRASVESFEWAMEDRGEWLLLSKDAANFKYISDIAPYVAINKEAANFDVQARIFLGKERVVEWMADLKKSVVERHTVATGGDHEPIDIYNKTRFLDFAAQAAENFDWAEIGLNFSSDNITIGSMVKAADGTPEAALLSTPIEGVVSEAKFVPNTSMMSYVGRYNVDAVVAYYDVLESRANALVGEKGKAWLKKVGDMMRTYAKMSDGTVASTMRFDAAQPDIVSVGAGSYSEEFLVKSTKEFYNDLLPEFFDAIPYFKRHGVNYTFSFNEDAAEIEGVKVHEAVVEMAMQPPAEQAAALPENVKEKLNQTTTSYFAIVDGSFITATTLDALKPIVTSVKASVPADNNIYSLFSYEKGAAIEYQVSLIDYFSAGMDQLDDIPAMATYKTALDELKSAKLAPATGAWIIGGGSAKGTFSMPNTSISKIAKTFQKYSSSAPQGSTEPFPGQDPM